MSVRDEGAVAAWIRACSARRLRNHRVGGAAHDRLRRYAEIDDMADALDKGSVMERSTVSLPNNTDDSCAADPSRREAGRAVDLTQHLAGTSLTFASLRTISPSDPTKIAPAKRLLDAPGMAGKSE